MVLDIFPPELLGEFFAHAKNDSWLAPVVLSHVCETWRQAALGDQSLWQKIVLEMNKMRPQSLYQLTRMFLARSRRYPLSVTFTQNHMSSEDTTKEIINLVVDESYRWRSLELSLCHPSEYLESFLTYPAPALQRLSIRALGSKNLELLAIFQFLQFSTSVQSILLDLQSIYPFDATFKTPPNTLSSLVLSQWRSAPSLLLMLKDCPHLQTLTLGNLTTSHTDLPGLAVENMNLQIELPNIQRIYIYQTTLDASLYTLLDNMTCPKLSQLDISCGFVDNIRWPTESFVGFVQRSLCPLKSLLLEMVQITEEQLTRCLESCSNTLESLEIIEYRDVFCVGDDLLCRLKAGKQGQDPCGNRGALCPNLRTFHVWDAIECTDGALSALLRSRTVHTLGEMGCSLCVPLEDVKIRIRQKFRRDLPSDMQYLKENKFYAS